MIYLYTPPGTVGKKEIGGTGAGILWKREYQPIVKFCTGNLTGKREKTGDGARTGKFQYVHPV